MEVSVMQWNAWYDEDIHNVANLIKEHNPDIACLQELTIGFPGREISDTPAYLAEQLGYEYHHKEIPIESTTGQKLMLATAIFSRFPIIDRYDAWINQPKQGGGYGDEYRGYVEATVDINGSELTVGTVHMSYTDRFNDTPGKDTETANLLKELGRDAGHYIFTGDLNAKPGSNTINSLDAILKDAGPDRSQKTWTTKPFSYNGFEESDLNWRLDYVFTTPDLKAISSEIIDTQFSDHLPILTKMDL